MKKRMVLIPAAAVLLLLVGIAARHEPVLRTVLVGAGVFVTLAGMAVAAAAKSGRRFIGELAVILAAYVLYAASGFQTATFGAFLPDGCTVQRVEITLRESDEPILWTPDGQDDSADELRRRADDIVLRSYWSPGFVEDGAVAGVTAELTCGEEPCRISLEQDGEVYSLSVRTGEEETENSSWLLYGDLMSLIPDGTAQSE